MPNVRHVQVWVSEHRVALRDDLVEVAPDSDQTAGAMSRLEVGDYLPTWAIAWLRRTEETSQRRAPMWEPIVTIVSRRSPPALDVVAGDDAAEAMPDDVHFFVPRLGADAFDVTTEVLRLGISVVSGSSSPC